MDSDAPAPHAVVFDLWKTLVPLSEQAKRQAFEDTALVLGSTPDQLREPWQRTRRLRETGDLRSYLLALRQELGADWDDEQLEQAMKARTAVHGAEFSVPAAGAVDTLTRLRAAGLRIGLVSNCSSDVRDMLDTSALGSLLDTVVLSAEVGLMKPDAGIFQLAARRLAVEPHTCLYVGDGNDGELDGAARAGMKPILLDLDEGHAWTGTRIRSLTEVLPHAGISRAA